MIAAARRDLLPLLVAAITVPAALAFLVYPLAHVALAAFLPNGAETSLANLTLANFERFFTSRSYQRALVNSVVSCGAATLLATALAVPMAWAVARVEIAFRSLAIAASVLPLIAPPFIGAYAWIMLFGNAGAVTKLTGGVLPSIYGPFGVILALALSYFPYVFLIAQAALAAADRTIEEAATMAGASRLGVIRTITLPLILPAVAAGMLIVFIKSLGDFGVPSILGGEYQVLPTLIYYQIHGFFNLNAGSAIAIVNVALTVAALGFLAWLNRRRGAATLTGSAAAAPRLATPGARWAGTLYVWSVLGLALLPQLVVAVYSFAERWADTALPEIYGLANYRRVFGDAGPPILNSIILGGTATALCLVFGTITAYASVRGRMAARWALDLTIMLPFVLPGIVVGVAYLTAFNDPPFVLTGGALILILAYFTRRAAFVFRSAAAAIAAIDPRIEEASTICGAGWGATMRRVTVPLIAPALVAGGVLVFATLIGEISATVLLYSAQWKTISIAIYELVLGNDLAKASALGTICNVATLLLVLAASRLAKRNMADLFR